jgi:enoyl-CoA hydratase
MRAGMASLQIHEEHDRILAGIDRPDTRNALDRELIDELHALCDALESFPRILVLTGTQGDPNPVFASGADIRELHESRGVDALRGGLSALLDRIARLPLPVIAAVDGFALGGGAELALAADFRLATPRARFGNPETGLGIMAAAGGTFRLRSLVGDAVAAEMLLAGRILSAGEALDLHLVTEVHEPEELMAAASRLADRIAAQDPVALRVTKVVMRMPRSAHPMVDDIAQAALFESPGKRERMSAFLNRQPSGSQET